MIDSILDRIVPIGMTLFFGYIIMSLFFGDCQDPNALNYNPDAWFNDHDVCEYKPLTAKELYDLNKWLNSSDDIDCESYDYWGDCIDMGCHWEAFDEYSGYCTDGY